MKPGSALAVDKVVDELQPAVQGIGEANNTSWQATKRVGARGGHRPRSAMQPCV
jgi:hypothetical protein